MTAPGPSPRAVPGGRSRLRRILRAPASVWFGSLPLRVVASTLVATMLVLLGGGFLLMQQASQGVVEGKKRQALIESSIAMQEAQSTLQAADLSQSNPNEVLTRLAFEVASRGSSSGQFQVIVQGPVSDIRSGQILPDSVPDGLRERVTREPNTWVAPTTVHYSDGTAGPGLAVGASLSAVGVGRYPIFFVFPLDREVETLRVLQRAVITTGALLVLALGGVAWLVARQVVTPVREARLAAERLASGHLDDRMAVRGTDDIAGLAVSMNFMAGELQKQISQLEELSRVQQQFVSDVSHELRTPLTTVRMATEMLYDGREEFSPIAARSAELLFTEVERFDGLLGDLLEISRFDAGAAVLAVENTDLGALASREVGAQQSFAEECKTPLRLHVHGDTTAEVDPRRITRVLRNLITNAIEHGEQQPIDVYVAGDERAVAIAVRDHGLGFEASQVKQVFHRFWRADPSRARKVGGTGLGLAISMEDARLHGGWLNAWGRPGLGAQFRLTVPKTHGAILEISPLPVVPRDLSQWSVRRSAPTLALLAGPAIPVRRVSGPAPGNRLTDAVDPDPAPGGAR